MLCVRPDPYNYHNNSENTDRVAMLAFGALVQVGILPRAKFVGPRGHVTTLSTALRLALRLHMVVPSGSGPMNYDRCQTVWTRGQL
jgi:hypothetical protein